MKKSLILSILAVLLMGIASCKKDDDNKTTSKSLVGTFETTSNRNGYNAVLYVTDATHFSYTVDNFINSNTYTGSGTYATSGTEVTFTENGSSGCANIAGKYSYNVTDTTLTFSPISDPCNNADLGGSRSALFIGEWDKI